MHHLLFMNFHIRKMGARRKLEQLYLPRRSVFESHPGPGFFFQPRIISYLRIFIFVSLYWYISKVLGDALKHQFRIFVMSVSALAGK